MLTHVYMYVCTYVGVCMHRQECGPLLGFCSYRHHSINIHICCPCLPFQNLPPHSTSMDVFDFPEVPSSRSKALDDRGRRHMSGHTGILVQKSADGSSLPT